MSDKLTPEQIKNWRNILYGMIGPYTKFMTDEQIQAFRDKMQSDIDKNREKRKNTKEAKTDECKAD